MSRRVIAMLASIAVVALGPTTEALAQQASGGTGVLLLAHGGSAAWNDNVKTIASAVERTMPVEVAFGMATRANIQLAIDRLVARRVARIVAVPLFVSSYSSVITSTEYLLGLRTDMPAALPRFAAMSHGHAAQHQADKPSAEIDGTTPVQSPVPLSMTGALDAHPVVSAIVLSRASGISSSPEGEAVVLVAHGPVDDASNVRWLATLEAVAKEVRRAGYQSVDAVTVRDDAPPAIKDQATAALRLLVQRRAKEGRVLVVPVLLSFGGIEDGIRKRLAGLEFSMSSQALAPDSRLVSWVLEMARSK